MGRLEARDLARLRKDNVDPKHLPGQAELEKAALKGAGDAAGLLRTAGLPSAGLSRSACRRAWTVARAEGFE